MVEERFYPLNLTVSSLQHILAMKSDSSRAKEAKEEKERIVVAHYIIVKQAASSSDGTNRQEKQTVNKDWAPTALIPIHPFPFIHPTIPIPHFTAKLNAPSSIGVNSTTTTTTKCTAIPVNWQGRITCR